VIYLFLKRIIHISLFFFFKKVVVVGKENIPQKGPLIIVANHPNTVIDPLIIAAIIKQRIGFIANASIFVNKLLNTIFSYFHLIPIYRKKDVIPGQKPDNKNTFIRCHEYLEQGRTFLIFPEGSSHYELKLREIKTGTARIALSFEALKNFNGDLKILPIALDYSDAIQFRSMVSVTINPPLSVYDYKELYLSNNIEGVSNLTEDIRKTLAKNIPHTSGKDQENFLIKAHKFYTAYQNPKLNLYQNPKQSLVLRNKISKALRYLNKQDPLLYQNTQTKLLSFFNILKKEKLTSGFFTNHFLKKNKAIVMLNYILKFILISPLYLFGVLINYAPYILPSKIFKALNIDIEYKTSVQMLTGLITFPLFYTLEIWLFRNYISDNFWLTMLLPILFLVTGYIAMFYWIEIKRFIRILRFSFFMKSDTKLIVLQLRDEILNNMETAKESL